MEAMQLHSAWLLKRPGLLRLLAGYAGSACRPTVTLPYLPLLLALLFFRALRETRQASILGIFLQSPDRAIHSTKE